MALDGSAMTDIFVENRNFLRNIRSARTVPVVRGLQAGSFTLEQS